jgi:glycosyltransferase involved in cell wall biosynthesis
MQLTTSDAISSGPYHISSQLRERYASGCAVVDIVIPVYNEERALRASVRHLRSYLDENLPWPAVVTIVDNASTDSTSHQAEVLVSELAGVRWMRIAGKGRGRALRAAWEGSEAAVVAYMDVDLSTSLDALLPLLAPLVSGHSAIAIGSRLAPGARVVRAPKREVISRGYNLLLHAVLANGFTDAQCGFKAMRAEAARALLPEVADNGWFFDTELLVLAEERGMRVHEVAVDWVDDPDSRVEILRTARDDLLGVLRLLRRHFRADRGAASVADLRTDPALLLKRFTRIGTPSTVAFLLLFFALRSALGPAVADLAALAVCTAGSAAAYRFLTVRGRVRGSVTAVALAGAYATSAVITLLVLGALGGLGWTSSIIVAAALVVASALAALVRFVLLEMWIGAAKDGAVRVATGMPR